MKYFYFWWVDFTVTIFQLFFICGGIWLYGWQHWNGWWVVLGLFIGATIKTPKFIQEAVKK